VPAAADDLNIVFAMVAEPPDEVTTADVLGFITSQPTGRADARVVQEMTPGGEPGGVSTSTVARRLSTISGFFGYLRAHGEIVPRRSEHDRVAAAEGAWPGISGRGRRCRYRSG
jgi:integrase/recombinase XerD